MLPIIIIVGGIILRSIAPVLFYILGIAFLAFLFITAYAGIAEKEYSWKEAIATGIYVLIILVLMLV